MRLDVTAGQYLDVHEETAWPSIDESEHLVRAQRVIVFKSAKYSIEAPLVIGALVAGASEAQLEGLRSFGLPLGVAYQLRDDVLGVFGDPEVTGKPAGDDLREGKRTMLIAYAATTDCWDDIAPYLGDPELSEERADELRATLQTCGAKSAAESRIAEHAALARAELAALPYELAERLEHLVSELLERVR